MPATALDSRTALVIIDLQKGLASLPSVTRVFPRYGEIDTTARILALVGC